MAYYIAEREKQWAKKYAWYDPIFVRKNTHMFVCFYNHQDCTDRHAPNCSDFLFLKGG